MLQHIINMFYIGILCTTLKERNIKLFVQNCYSSKSPSTHRDLLRATKFASLIFFYYQCITSLVWLLENLHIAWSKVETPLPFVFLMPLNMYQYWKQLPNIRHFYYIFKFRDNFSTFLIYILGVPNLHTSCCN